jgi:hypothetical protein
MRISRGLSLAFAGRPPRHADRRGARSGAKPPKRRRVRLRNGRIAGAEADGTEKSGRGSDRLIAFAARIRASQRLFKTKTHLHSSRRFFLRLRRFYREIRRRTARTAGAPPVSDGACGGPASAGAVFLTPAGAPSVPPTFRRAAALRACPTPPSRTGDTRRAPQAVRPPPSAQAAGQSRS